MSRMRRPLWLIGLAAGSFDLMILLSHDTGLPTWVVLVAGLFLLSVMWFCGHEAIAKVPAWKVRA